MCDVVHTCKKNQLGPGHERFRPISPIPGSISAAPGKVPVITILEDAQEMAAHESPRTTKLYDRTGDEITLDEVERITI
jgi:hypothetical protein